MHTLNILLSQIPASILILSALASLISIFGLCRFFPRAEFAPYLTWKRVALSTLLVLVLGTPIPANVVAYRRAWSLVHPLKHPAGVTPNIAGIRDYDDVRFSTPDGVTIAAWYVPGRLSASVIFLNGYGANRARFLTEAETLNQLGFHVLLIDCRACGESSGSLNTFGVSEVGDVQGGIDFLSRQPNIDPNRIGLVGHSQGAATAILAAAQIPQVAAVTSISAFTSLEENINSAVQGVIGASAFPFAPMVIFWGEQITGLDLDKASPIDAIGKISPRPVLIVHGDQDTWVPVENAQRLYAAAGIPKELLIVPGAGHSNVPRTGGELFRSMFIEFFEHALLDH